MLDFCCVLYRETEKEEKELDEMMMEFMADSSRQEHSFPSSLSSRQRFLVHEVSVQIHGCQNILEYLLFIVNISVSDMRPDF